MAQKPLIPETRKPSQTFGDINAEAPLWILLPKMLAAILISAALILLRFWFYFGELSFFACGFVIFTSVLQILIIVGLRFQNRMDFHTTKSVRNNWFDKLGAWWLVACAFGAFFGWICGNLANAFPAFKMVILTAEIFFTIFLPIITMLPNLRYVGAKASVVQIPILFFVTVLPMLVGLNSLFTIWNKLNN
jgi:hypothetical protein